MAILVYNGRKLACVEIRRIVSDPNDRVNRFKRLFDGGQSASAGVDTCELRDSFIKTSFGHGGSKGWEVGQLDKLMRFFKHTVTHSTYIKLV